MLAILPAGAGSANAAPPSDGDARDRAALGDCCIINAVAGFGGGTYPFAMPCDCPNQTCP